MRMHELFCLLCMHTIHCNAHAPRMMLSAVLEQHNKSFSQLQRTSQWQCVAYIGGHSMSDTTGLDAVHLQHFCTAEGGSTPNR